MSSIKRLALRAALAATIGAAVLTGGSSPASANAQYWSDRCDSGRACIWVQSSGRVWNVDSCGLTGLGDYFVHARAQGNAFRIQYGPTRYDYVAAWTERPLDGVWRASSVYVYC